MENANGIINLTNLISKNQKKRMDEILKELENQEKEELRKLRVKFANKRKKILSGKIEKKTTRRKTIPKPLKNSVWDEYIGKNYNRIRIGIGHPGEKRLVEKYVLSDFKKEEWSSLSLINQNISQNINLLVNKKHSSFLNKIKLN